MQRLPEELSELSPMTGLDDPFARYSKVLIAAISIGLFVSLYRLFFISFSFAWGAQAALICLAILLLINRQKFSLATVTRGVLLLFFISCLLGMLTLGLEAGAFLVLFIIPMLLVAFTSYRAALMSLFGIVATILVIGALFSLGVLPPNSLPPVHNSDMAQWALYALLFAGSAYTAVHVTHMLRLYWQDAFAQLTDSHDEVQALIDYSPGSIMIFDLDENRFTSANQTACEEFGATVSELTSGLSYNDLYAEPEQREGEKTEPLISHLLAALHGAVRFVDTDLRKFDGTKVPVELMFSHLPIKNRRVVRLTSVDITRRKLAEQERKLLEAQLAQSQRLEAVGKLSGGVAHDFNNLMAVILGNVELLRDQEKDPENLAMMDSIIASVNRGSDLTQNMLSFARRARLSPEVVDLNAIVRDIQNWAGRTLPAHVELELSLLADLWPIEVDQSALQNAILNLLINARDAMPEGGKLTIETSNLEVKTRQNMEDGEEIEPGRYTVLAISDTGTGIPASVLDRIFEPFFSTKPAGHGSGLGLSMVMGFMRQSGGAVRAQSESGQGTTLTLFFKTSNNKIHETQVQPAPVPQRASQGHSVLVVEDEPELLALLVTTLTKAGFEVGSATSGDAAYEMFQANSDFDLLLTDIVMPGKLQGTSLSRALRELKPDLPAIFLSGYASEASLHGNGLRPEDIRLMKPVTRKALLEAIDTALSGGALIQEEPQG